MSELSAERETFDLARCEKSIIKKFHKQLFRRFTKAVVTYNLDRKSTRLNSSHMA